MKVAKATQNEITDLHNQMTEQIEGLEIASDCLQTMINDSDELSALHAIEERINDLRDSLVSVIDEATEGLQSKHDERSEKWQESEKGEASEELIGDLENFSNEIGDCEVDTDLDLSGLDVEVPDIPDLPPFDSNEY